jgi:tetratricopeptide (TPR) repeat protein
VLRWPILRKSAWWLSERFASVRGWLHPSHELLVWNAAMRYVRYWISAALFLAPLSAGCRLPGREGPVPQSLTDCRRLSQQGVAALERGEQPKAETLLAQAVTACPVDSEARRHYAESLWRRGAKQEAIIQLEEASRLAGEDAPLWARLAEMRLASNQHDLARKAADTALNLDPKLPNAWAVRAGVMQAVGQPRDALADYLHALSYAPNDRAILREIAELHRQLNQPDRALEALQALAETYPAGEEPGQVLYLTGLAYVALGRYDDGVESLSAAATRGKPTAEIFCQLGEAQLLAGHPPQAAEAARQALALEPQHQLSRNLLQRVEVAQQPQPTLTR